MYFGEHKTTEQTKVLTESDVYFSKPELQRAGVLVAGSGPSLQPRGPEPEVSNRSGPRAGLQPGWSESRGPSVGLVRIPGEPGPCQSLKRAQHLQS